MFELSCMLGYVGPGAGLSMLGALLAVGGLLVFALLAPFLYIVRLVRVLFVRTRTAHAAALPPHVAQK